MKWCKEIGAEVDMEIGTKMKESCENESGNGGRKWRGMGESGLLNFWETGNWDRAVRNPPSPHTPISTPLSTTSPHQSPILIPIQLPHSVITSFSFPYHSMEKHSDFRRLTDFNRAFPRQISTHARFTSVITVDLFSIS